MTSIKSLADEIRERQQQEVKEASKKRINKKVPPSKGKEEKETRERQDPKQDGRIIGLILDSGKSEEPVNMIHIRLPSKIYRKLITLNAAKITMQKFAAFAITQLLEHPDIKEKLKEIFNDME
ncbi:MAG: hypothetical protein AB2L20_07490 [Mangrovibacterium sp.]